jgi:hypothetical protein
MAVVVFAAIYLLAATTYWVVTRLAGERSSACLQGGLARNAAAIGHPFRAAGWLFAVEVWNNFDKAKGAVASEAGALRAVVLFAENFPEEQKTRIHALVDRHIDEAVNREWPTMARHKASLSTMRANALIEMLHTVLTLKPADDSQRAAQPEMMEAIEAALDARRQRIVVSQSSVGRVKWAGILLQGLCTLIAIAMVHSDNRLACAIAMTLFATGIALSLLLIGAYSRPFTGEISVKPDLLKQVITSGAPVTRQ